MLKIFNPRTSMEETWGLTENNKRRFEAREMDALRRSYRI
jgi:hypothetical protein